MSAVVSYAYKMKDDPNLQLSMVSCENIETVNDWNRMMNSIANARPDIDPHSVIILNIINLR